MRSGQRVGSALGVLVVIEAGLAGTIQISPIAGGVTLESGPLGGTVFGAGQPAWSTASLASAHASINASGIATDGKVTMAAADTDHGLALLVLIDRELGQEGPGPTGHLHMTSVGDGANLAYVNDIAEAFVVTPNGSGSRIATGTFTWGSEGHGDGFAWANLITGNTMTFRFEKVLNQALGLVEPGTFQFVTWTGANWALVPIDPEGSFTGSGEYGFDARVVTVIPVPMAAALALVPLALVPARRARR